MRKTPAIKENPDCLASLGQRISNQTQSIQNKQKSNTENSEVAKSDEPKAQWILRHGEGPTSTAHLPGPPSLNERPSCDNGKGTE